MLTDRMLAGGALASPETAVALPVGGFEARKTLSVVTPAYNEAENLPRLYKRVSAALDCLPLQWEWVVVDDHSSDQTYDVASKIASTDHRVRAIRLARNCGSHAAIACGLDRASGDGAIVMAADLQDPPEMIPLLVERWRQGAQVVWAVRSRNGVETSASRVLPRLYYFIMRRIVGMTEMPATGADFLLIDRRVVNALSECHENNASILATIAWLGFRQASVPYTKEPRLRGRTGWSLEKRLKLVVDSVTAYSYVPIRLMSYLGFGTAAAGFLYAGLVIVNALRGMPVEGWSSLMVVALVLSGVQMTMLGVLGEYLWRALDAARGRPRYIVESEVDWTPEADRA
jgi:polyisoprenyl-phosphate glycosyltransferase